MCIKSVDLLNNNFRTVYTFCDFCHFFHLYYIKSLSKMELYWAFVCFWEALSLQLESTADPQIISFWSMLFHYTDDEEKNIDFQLWPLSTWSLHILPVSAWIFSGASGFPHSKDVHVRWTCVSKLSQFEYVWTWVWVCPAMEGFSVQGGFPSSTRWPWTEISDLENNDLTYFC